MVYDIGPETGDSRPQLGFQGEGHGRQGWWWFYNDGTLWGAAKGLWSVLNSFEYGAPEL